MFRQKHVVIHYVKALKSSANKMYSASVQHHFRWTNSFACRHKTILLWNVAPFSFDTREPSDLACKVGELRRFCFKFWLRVISLLVLILFPIILYWLAPFSQLFFLKPYISSPLPSFVTSALKMETACFSETWASTYETIRRQNPRLQRHRTNSHENHISFDEVIFT
jgi:hypothetical protein